MARIKAGTLNVAIEDEEVLWYDRKRWGIFALPWSFTKYLLTKSRIIIKTGFLNSQEDEIRLYRITDVTLRQSFMERMNNTGTLCVISSDKTLPELHLRHIKNAKRVKAVLSQCVETARRENGVRTSELVDGHYPGDGHNHESMGPELVPDLNHNGIDDRTE